MQIPAVEQERKKALSVAEEVALVSQLRAEFKCVSSSETETNVRIRILIRFAKARAQI